MALVLVVDNEDDVRRAWEKALKHGDHQIWSAGTAEEALKLCDEHAFDVVVLDFIMPGVDGVRLLARIRKVLPFVRSLIVSGKLDTDVSAADLTAELKGGVEADAYLHKPLSNDDLRAAVNRLLSTSPQKADWVALSQTMVRAKQVTDKQAKTTARRIKGFKKR